MLGAYSVPSRQGHHGVNALEQSSVLSCQMIPGITAGLFSDICRVSGSGTQQPCSECPWVSSVTNNGDMQDCACDEPGTARSLSQPHVPVRFRGYYYLPVTEE